MEKNVKYLLFEDDMNGISSEDLAISLKNLLVKESFMHLKESYIWGHLFLSKKEGIVYISREKVFLLFSLCFAKKDNLLIFLDFCQFSNFEKTENLIF